jgi:hypothetical protein
MKYAGYRFQSASLNSALTYAAEVFWFNSDDGWYWDTARTPEAGEALRRLGVAATQAEFELVVAGCSETTRAALAEREPLAEQVGQGPGALGADAHVRNHGEQESERVVSDERIRGGIRGELNGSALELGGQCFAVGEQGPAHGLCVG